MKLTVSTLTVCALALTLLPTSNAQGSDVSDIELLKAKLAEQQKQIEVLRQSVDSQQKLIERLTAPAATPAAKPAEQAATQPAAKAPGFTPVGGAVASATGALPDLSPVAVSPKYSAQEPHHAGRLHGFHRRVARQRRRFGNRLEFRQHSLQQRGVNGNLSELHMSPQNSRIGFRIDGDWKGAHFIGYNEFDFLGTSASTNAHRHQRRLRAAPAPVLGGCSQGPSGKFSADRAGAC
jgi:uncharacterized coiled-coil protein SlyX